MPWLRLPKPARRTTYRSPGQAVGPAGELPGFLECEPRSRRPDAQDLGGILEGGAAQALPRFSEQLDVVVVGLADDLPGEKWWGLDGRAFERMRQFEREGCDQDREPDGSVPGLVEADDDVPYSMSLVTPLSVYFVAFPV